jgi:hypothetical protein
VIYICDLYLRSVNLSAEEEILCFLRLDLGAVPGVIEPGSFLQAFIRKNPKKYGAENLETIGKGVQAYPIAIAVVWYIHSKLPKYSPDEIKGVIINKFLKGYIPEDLAKKPMSVKRTLRQKKPRPKDTFKLEPSPPKDAHEARRRTKLAQDYKHLPPEYQSLNRLLFSKGKLPGLEGLSDNMFFGIMHDVMLLHSSHIIGCEAIKKRVDALVSDVCESCLDDSAKFLDKMRQIYTSTCGLLSVQSRDLDHGGFNPETGSPYSDAIIKLIQNSRRNQQLAPYKDSLDRHKGMHSQPNFECSGGPCTPRSGVVIGSWDKGAASGSMAGGAACEEVGLEDKLAGFYVFIEAIKPKDGLEYSEGTTSPVRNRIIYALEKASRAIAEEFPGTKNLEVIVDEYFKYLCGGGYEEEDSCYIKREPTEGGLRAAVAAIEKIRSITGRDYRGEGAAALSFHGASREGESPLLVSKYPDFY